MMTENKIIVYLKRLGQDICYGELHKMYKVKKDEPKLSPLEKTQKIVSELNDLLPNGCIKQHTMYYYYKEC